jgi:hypothetical protein
MYQIIRNIKESHGHDVELALGEKTSANVCLCNDGTVFVAHVTAGRRSVGRFCKDWDEALGEYKSAAMRGAIEMARAMIEAEAAEAESEPGGTHGGTTPADAEIEVDADGHPTDLQRVRWVNEFQLEHAAHLTGDVIADVEYLGAVRAFEVHVNGCWRKCCAQDRHFLGFHLQNSHVGMLELAEAWRQGYHAERQALEAAAMGERFADFPSVKNAPARRTAHLDAVDDLETLPAAEEQPIAKKAGRLLLIDGESGKTLLEIPAEVYSCGNLAELLEQASELDVIDHDPADFGGGFATWEDIARACEEHTDGALGVLNVYRVEFEPGAEDGAPGQLADALAMTKPPAGVMPLTGQRSLQASRCPANGRRARRWWRGGAKSSSSIATPQLRGLPTLSQLARSTWTRSRRSLPTSRRARTSTQNSTHGRAAATNFWPSCASRSLLKIREPVTSPGRSQSVKSSRLRGGSWRGRGKCKIVEISC